MSCGGTAVIANGNNGKTLDRIFAGERIGTVFLPSQRMKGKRRWIAYAADVRGRVVVDDGAQRAIAHGKASLLSSGIVRVENHFAALDVVSIVDSSGREFARGIANCTSQEAEQSAEPKDEVAGKRGGAKSRVVFTRDNIVLLEKS
jgi:glutamate 5-kinase